MSRRRVCRTATTLSHEIPVAVHYRNDIGMLIVNYLKSRAEPPVMFALARLVEALFYSSNSRKFLPLSRSVQLFSLFLAAYKAKESARERNREKNNYWSSTFRAKKETRQTTLCTALHRVTHRRRCPGVVYFFIRPTHSSRSSFSACFNKSRWRTNESEPRSAYKLKQKEKKKINAYTGVA